MNTYLLFGASYVVGYALMLFLSWLCRWVYRKITYLIMYPPEKEGAERRQRLKKYAQREIERQRYINALREKSKKEHSPEWFRQTIKDPNK